MPWTAPATDTKVTAQWKPPASDTPVSASKPAEQDGFFSSAWKAGGQPIVDAIAAKYKGLTTDPLGEILTAVQQMNDPVGTLLAMGKGAVDDAKQKIAKVREQASAGNYPGAAGTVVGTVAPFLLPELGELKVPAVLKDAAVATTEGVRAAAPEVAMGGAKVAAGAAADAAGLPYHAGVLFGAKEGAPQIVKGIVKGAKTAREKFAEARAAQPEVLQKAAPIEPYTPKPIVVEDGPRTSSGRLLTPDEIAFENAPRERRPSVLPEDEPQAPMPERVPVWENPNAKPADIATGPPSREVPPNPPRARAKPVTAEEKVAAVMESKPQTEAAPAAAENKFAEAARLKRADAVEPVAKMLTEGGMGNQDFTPVLTDVTKAAQLRQIAKAAGVGELPKDLTGFVKALNQKLTEMNKKTSPMVIMPSPKLMQSLSRPGAAEAARAFAEAMNQ